MSVYIQEVLGLLKRNKKKLTLDKQKDHFEFGKLFQNSSLNNAGTYGPRMEPFVIKWGDLVCQATEDLTRTQPGSGNLGYVPVYTDPEGTCSWDTLKDSIITQNAIGDTINIAGNLYVEGTITTPSLTEDRVVIVGLDGVLEDDQNLTFNGTELNIGLGKFTVQVSTGNTQIIGTLNVDDQSTLASANVEDLTDNRIVIVGFDGELEDDENFTMDGTTFTANVNVLHGAIITPIPAVPATTTVLNSNIVLGGPIYDSAGNIGQLSQVLVGLADGRAVWSNDDIVETLTLGSLWQGNTDNLKQELTIGSADQILISNGTTFAWQNNPAAIVGEVCTVNSIPLWTPNSNTLGCSLIFQNGNSSTSTPATQVTIGGKTIVQGDLNVKNDTLLEGNVEVNGTTKLDTIDQDDTLTQVLVRDINNDNLLKWRDSSTIFNGSGTLYRLPLWTPNGTSLGNSLLVQDGDENAATLATKVTVEGDIQINGTTKLDTISKDNTLTQVLVRDINDGNLVKWRDALSIVPDLGWDIVESTTGVADWDVVKFNGYMEINTTPPATRAIRPNNLTNAQEGYFVFVANASDIPLDFLQFTGINGSNALRVRTTWSGSGNNVYTPTAQSGGFWQYGTAVKFHYIVRESAGVDVIWWDACCEIAAQNNCPVGQSTSFNVNEDTPTGTLTLPATDDGLGVLSWSIIQQPLDTDGVTSAGTIALNSTNGTYVFTPALNYYGSGTFTWEVTDGYCASNVITVNFNVIAVSESPVFQVYNGVGGVCGAVSTPPVYQGSVGGSYLYEGNYCDPDHDYTQVTLTAEYSTDGQSTWNTGLPANFALVKDDLSGVTTPWRFTFTSSSVPIGSTCFRLTLTDPDNNTNQQIFCVTSAFEILQGMQFQMDYEGVTTAPAGQSRTPVATNDNLGEWSASQTVAGILSTGFALWNATTIPSGFGTNTASTAGVSPSGGTYPNIGTSTFNLYIRNGQIGAQVGSIPANDNISIGDTIIFDQATLNTALPTGGGFNSSLIYTIVQEDIKFAPNNQNSIPLVATGAMPGGHSCTDGGFRMILSVTNSSGAIETFQSRRFNCANLASSIIPRFSNTFDFPSAYINTGSGNNTYWSRDSSLGPWGMSATHLDQTDNGLVYDMGNTQQSALPGYYTSGYTYNLARDRSSGLFTLPDSLISQVAAASSDGIVRINIVGDTWIQSVGSGATVTVTSIGPGGTVTGVSPLNLTSATNYKVNGSGVNSNSAIGKWQTTSNSVNGSGLVLECNTTANSASALTNPATPWSLYPGTGYLVGDLITIDGDGTAHANTHGDAAGMRIFRESTTTPGTHVEVGIDPTTNRSLIVGGGTTTNVDLFNNTVTVT